MPDLGWSIIAGVVSGAGTAGIAWGLAMGRLRALEERMTEKASKESVDALREFIRSFKEDMDNRFDRLERMLSSKARE